MTERPPVATYRLQLRPGFGFVEAGRAVPYLAALGISHLYLSPVFEAVSGSTHGYDVVDYSRLRAEFGGEDAFNALAQTAHDRGLGIVIDIVPHHMAAAAENAWWWSVLELGEASPYSQHFDIDWDPPTRRLRGSVLLPVLGDHYGRVLESGELRLERGEDGALVARYYDHFAPLSPETADEIWAIAGRRSTAVDEVLAEINADRDRVDAILDRQHHRFARWQSANHELDYRRFFDIDSLVALRSERAAVFVDSHALTLRLVLDGQVDGLRVDHLDGLRDPAGYLERLRSHAPDAWIVAEKILRPGETLPAWPIPTTVGQSTSVGVLECSRRSRSGPPRIYGEEIATVALRSSRFCVTACGCVHVIRTRSVSGVRTVPSLSKVLMLNASWRSIAGSRSLSPCLDWSCAPRAGTRE
jgi:(1->4)-alpha-D-glucan 1-alpha-D-glucosylmutase